MGNLPYGTVASVSDQRIVTLYNKEGKKVGEIDFSGDKVIFEGSMDQSANSFFALLRDIINPFLKEEK